MTEDYERSPLWPILVEVARAHPLYPHHKAYVRDALLREKPKLVAKEVARELAIPLGEAMVILHELAREQGR